MTIDKNKIKALFTELSENFDPQTDEERRSADVIAEMTTQQKVSGFHALLGSEQSNSFYLEDTSGEHRLWRDLSPAGKLDAIAHDAAYYDVPFEAFATAARDSLGSDALLDASLRVALNNQRELTAIARLIPDDGRTEATPLVEQVKELIDELRQAERLLSQDRDSGRER